VIDLRPPPIPAGGISMYKTLTVVALLLAAFAFTSGSKSADAAPTTPSSPVIVARGKQMNQTAPIPPTTIFTPSQDGLFRLSMYGTMTTIDPNSQSGWRYTLTWTDASDTVNIQVLFASSDNEAGRWAGFSGEPAWTPAFQAKAGIPVTYSITQNGPPDSSVYALYWAVERLE